MFSSYITESTLLLYYKQGRLNAVQENISCLNTKIIRWKKFKFRVLQYYEPVKVTSMLTRVFKCQERQYIGLSQGNLSPKVGLPLEVVCLLKQNLMFRTT